MARYRLSVAIMFALILCVLGLTVPQLGATRRPASQSISADDSDYLEDGYNHTLLKRAHKFIYEDHVAYGKELMEKLKADISHVKQSQWTKYDDLESHGWTKERSENIDYENTGRIFMQTSMEQIFKKYDLSKDAKDNLLTLLRNDKPAKQGGKSYPASGAQYKNIFNSQLIIALDNESPSTEGPKQKPAVDKGSVTPLKRWWDVAFLQWQKFCDDDEAKMNKLVGIVRDHVSGDEAVPTVSRVLTDKTGSMWAPETFNQAVHVNMDEEGGLALLGCPNGRGVASFLAEHKEKLGSLTITGVKIYRPSAFAPYALMFEFGPAPKAETHKGILHKGIMHKENTHKENISPQELAGPSQP